MSNIPHKQKQGKSQILFPVKYLSGSLLSPPTILSVPLIRFRRRGSFFNGLHHLPFPELMHIVPPALSCRPETLIARTIVLQMKQKFIQGINPFRIRQPAGRHLLDHIPRQIPFRIVLIQDILGKIMVKRTGINDTKTHNILLPSHISWLLSLKQKIPRLRSG